MELNKIHLGNSYELIKEIPDKSVDLIVTDPPYQIKGVHKGTGIFKYRTQGYLSELADNDSIIVKGIDDSILDEMCRVMKKINIYLWCNKEQIPQYLDYFVKGKGCNFEILIWAKQNPPPFYSGHYIKDKEYCLFFWETGACLKPESLEKARTVWFSKLNIEDKKKYGHPTIKPLEFIKTLIENSSARGGVDT